MGPLTGIKVIELAGIGPGPFAAMVLADLGADVIRVDRVDRRGGLPGLEVLSGRGRRSIAIDLKQAQGIELVLRLVETADVLVEGFRPGVAERLGVGPEVCRARNPRLVYARMTGWGQEGPLASDAGHDIDYIALSGALHSIGRAGERPVPPLNLVGDYGGGAMLLVVGVLAALVERAASGVGDVVDAAMIDGSALLMQPIYQLASLGIWRDERGVNLLDGAAPFYDTYETADGKAVAVGPLEPHFYVELLAGLDIDPGEMPPQLDVSTWPEVKARFAEVFRSASRDEWEQRFAGTDACVAPVLSLTEAIEHPHNTVRGTFVDIAGSVEPAPAPRFARSRAGTPTPPVAPGAHTREILRSLGAAEDDVRHWLDTGVVA